MKAIRSMTKEERKAMDSEIRRRCVEICNQYEIDYDTIITCSTFIRVGVTSVFVISTESLLKREKNLRSFTKRMTKTLTFTSSQ